jgi:hypothetical protein
MNKFDELTKGIAQSVTRRQAFKKFGLGLAGMALACFGLANKAEAGHGGCIGSGHACAQPNTIYVKKSCLSCCSGRFAFDSNFLGYHCL